MRAVRDPMARVPRREHSNLLAGQSSLGQPELSWSIRAFAEAIGGDSSLDHQWHHWHQDLFGTSQSLGSLTLTPSHGQHGGQRRLYGTALCRTPWSTGALRCGPCGPVTSAGASTGRSLSESLATSSPQRLSRPSQLAKANACIGAHARAQPAPGRRARMRLREAEFPGYTSRARRQPLVELGSAGPRIGSETRVWVWGQQYQAYPPPRTFLGAIAPHTPAKRGVCRVPRPPCPLRRGGLQVRGS